MQKNNSSQKKFRFQVFNSLIFQLKNIFRREKNNNNQENSEVNEELTRYINKIFEQQEKERIVRWLVNSIRETLELDKVLETIVREIGALLNVDRCIIALFEKDEQKFYFRNEYRKDESIFPLIKGENTICEIPDKWQKFLIKNFCPVLIDDSQKDLLEEEEKKYLKINSIKSLIIIPIVHKEEFLGILMAHQFKHPRKWEETHFEILKDTGSQVAIAINQAILYSKIQEATKLKNDFLAGMSHELRTPLNAIIGFSEMLLSENYGNINEKQKKFLNNIYISGEHLLRLVNDILDLSKIETGNMEIIYEKFQVQTPIKETVSVLNSLAVKRSVTIEMEIEHDLSLSADLRRFKQIMYNLLSNAIKFSQEKERVKVKAFREGKNIRVEVHDRGIGITWIDREKIFKSFCQLDSSITRKQEGTGLGLTLTKKFIELHKGEINFESEKDKGSVFWFTLPEVKPDITENTDSDPVFSAS